ncbi:39S ribosomal protein L22, mitochondrial [Saxophila tyrrhenica]|uniref:39S ribosomal protein L22, mitochondrial n=1 Tax=Saxophila tyrrhenica TaxID=1690608 RepID=A0AAV9NXX9_9PEZI|nr:39S ribosomal protein L22, mitochondrial [Saxophila tyrrhenica]
MSISAPSRRMAPRGLLTSLPIRTQTRAFTSHPHRLADNDTQPPPSSRPNPFLAEYLRNNPSAPSTPAPPRQEDTLGDLPATSIFEDDRRAAQQAAAISARDASGGAKEMKHGMAGRNAQNMLRVTDPNPNARERFERKKVIQMVRKGGRLSKQEFVKKTEREHLVKSENFKTSVKKLGALARQIQGKRIDDAIAQMRFSRKKVAAEVLRQLEFARDEAVVMRGMGLGGVEVAQEAETLNASGEEVAGATETAAQTKKRDEPVEIQLKDGKRHTIENRSDIYIDQAWVGRGPYGQLPDYRARGRVFVMRTPWTSISLLLKEESTRVREYEEREAKRRRQRMEKVWVHLPDRPIQTKQQWYSW